MKINDFEIDGTFAADDLTTLYGRINDNATDYPRHATLHQLFGEQARRHPGAVAVRDAVRQLTYRELDEESDRLARFLGGRGFGPDSVGGLLLDRSTWMAVAQLGILKAGGAYLPLSSDMPFGRMRYLLEDAGAPVLIFDAPQIRDANKLQWECPELKEIFCIDREDIYDLREETGELMKEDTWSFLRRDMHDDISGGGWRSSFTGELLSREVMDDYASNIEKKLAPLVDSRTRVLEVGCASGMSLFRLAPKVASYYGTELTGEILDWTAEKAREKGHENVTLRQLAAHETERIDEGPFDVVIINSVIQCFSGHNYLREALSQAVDVMADRGVIFLGNVWDQDLKDAFTDDLERFEREHMGEGYTTKTDRYEELFVARDWFRDLQCDWPHLTEIDFSALIADHPSELTDYSYDVMLKVDKTADKTAADKSTAAADSAKSRYQFGRSALPDRGDQPPAHHSADGSLGEAHPHTGKADTGGADTNGANTDRAKQPACLIYTSGSTGRPKGVLLSHRNLVRLTVNTNYIEVTSEDRLIQGGAPSFDASILETWLALLNGVELVYPRHEELLEPGTLARFLQEHRITVAFLTTRLFNMMADHDPKAFDGLRVLMTGGERASAPRFNAVRKALPELRLINAYGPAENGVYATVYHMEEPCEGEVPIGVPVANSSVYILDRSRNLVPRGMTGELYVGGDGVALGYLGRPELTARAFLPSPFAEGDRLYRTGDLVRLNADGVLEFIGRADRQVKIRGTRVEAGEVEHLLLDFPQVIEAVVMPVEEGDELMLGAYLVSETPLDVDLIRSYLRRRLPEQMVPSRFRRLRDLPLNANGKLDPARLPGFAGEGSAARTTRPPSTETETALLPIWQEVLRRDDVGVEENFFDLGGHSLSTTQLVSAIERRMGVVLPLALLFSASTIRELGAYIDSLATVDMRIVHDEMATLAEPGGKPGQNRSLFAFPPGSGYALSYGALAAQLPPWGFRAFSFIEGEHRLGRYVDLITRAEDPPYTLFGYSGGGKLAWLVAQELERRGQPVERVVMVDAARYLREVPVTEADLQFYIADFLEGISSEVLRSRVDRKMRAYRQFLSGVIESGTVEADIHVIHGEDAEEIFYGPDGQPWATLVGWEESTRGRFRLLQGSGAHTEMLKEPHLDKNINLIRSCLQ